MNHIYKAKEYFEEILLGTNYDGMGFVNESLGSFRKSFINTLGYSGIDYSNHFISVGVLASGVLEIGVDHVIVHSNGFCSCLHNDICRKLSFDSRYLRVNRQRRIRPFLRIGDRIGHRDLVQDNSWGSPGFFLLPEFKGGELSIVSNNHVLADTNNGQQGDPIYSIDRFSQSHHIGYLEHYVPIYKDAVNQLDMAVASMPEYKYNGVPNGHYRAPRMGEQVHKTGAKTGKTYGTIRSLDYTAKINFGNDAAVFTNQIQIASTTRGASFSQPGDSGSLIRASSDGAFIGLLFAGNGQMTFANPHRLVANQLRKWGYNVR